MLKKLNRSITQRIRESTGPIHRYSSLFFFSIHFLARSNLDVHYREIWLSFTVSVALRIFRMKAKIYRNSDCDQLQAH